MTRSSRILPLFLVMTLTALAGCGSSSSVNVPPAPLSAGNVNLIFVVSEDLTYNAPGDVNPSTANLTNQGLQRSLLMATYLKQQVLGTKNVTGIYGIEPTTHPQTANNYPDMGALVTIQQFALLNQVTMSSAAGAPTYTGNSYPLNVSYAAGAIPSGVATPLPALSCPGCQGLDFNDTNGNNEALVAGVVKAGVPGFYVFSAPWGTISTLLAKFNKQAGYYLDLPAAYMGPNYVYAISIAPSGGASLVTYNSNLNPASTYPVLPSPVASVSCTPPSPSSITVTGGIGGAVIPAGINTNETLYIIRHAEAHPTNYFADGNFVGAGQWRALALANALKGKISPTQVFSTDPSQVTPGAMVASGNSLWSNPAPSLTVEPYAIANNLPYSLVSSFLITDPSAEHLAQLTSDFFFSGGKLSNQTALLAWQYVQIPQAVNALFAGYFPNGGAPTAPNWSPIDYDTIWTVTLDAKGNLTVDYALCEGINSAALPVTAPRF